MKTTMIRDMCSGCGIDHIGDIFVRHVLIESSLGCGHMAATAYYNGIAREVIHALSVNYSLRVDVKERDSPFLAIAQLVYVFSLYRMLGQAAVYTDQPLVRT